MSPLPKFLVVDFHAESRFLLVKTLLRKFPGAAIFEEDDAERALELVRTRRFSAIITHRTFEVSGLDLVRMFREAAPELPIIMVSGIDRGQAALAAGATNFLPYDEWLRIGSVVETHLGPGDAAPASGSHDNYAA
jgi:DNA-binding NtrC family response regulator